MNPDLNEKRESRSRRKVALLMHTASDWTRQILRGVATFAQEQGLWDFWLEPRGYYEKLTLPKDWDGDGAIARLTHPGIEQAVLESQTPTVNVSWLGGHCSHVSRVNSDEKACAYLGAQHFLERGYSHFGYLGPALELGYQNLALSGFNEVVNAKGFQCDVFIPPNGNGEKIVAARREKLKNWLRGTPKPIGILVWDSQGGYELAMVCKSLGYLFTAL